MSSLDLFGLWGLSGRVAPADHEGLVDLGAHVHLWNPELRGDLLGLVDMGRLIHRVVGDQEDHLGLQGSLLPQTGCTEFQVHVEGTGKGACPSRSRPPLPLCRVRQGPFHRAVGICRGEVDTGKGSQRRDPPENQGGSGDTHSHQKREGRIDPDAGGMGRVDNGAEDHRQTS